MAFIVTDLDGDAIEIGEHIRTEGTFIEIGVGGPPGAEDQNYVHLSARDACTFAKMLYRLGQERLDQEAF